MEYSQIIQGTCIENELRAWHTVFREYSCNSLAILSKPYNYVQSLTREWSAFYAFFFYFGFLLLQYSLAVTLLWWCPVWFLMHVYVALKWNQFSDMWTKWLSEKPLIITIPFEGHKPLTEKRCPLALILIMHFSYSLLKELIRKKKYVLWKSMEWICFNKNHLLWLWELI